MTTAELLLQEIQQNPHVRPQRVQVVELPEAIVIQGEVSSYYQKQMLTETAIRLFREKKIRVTFKNNVIVLRQKP